MTISKSITAFALALSALGAAIPAFAHGLLMQLDSAGSTISGQVYFSNGEQAGGVWIEMFDEGAPDIALETVQAGPDGSFRIEGEQGRSYQLRATGEEGHAIAMSIALEGDAARGAMVEDAADTSEPAGEEPADFPAWAFLGGFLLLSLIPALWLRRRGRPAAAE